MGGIDPTPKPHNSVTHTPLVYPDLYILAQTADSSSGHEPCRRADIEARGWGYCISQADALRKGVLRSGKIVFAVWEKNSV